MKLLLATTLMLAAVTAPAFADNPRDRPGGYNEQVKNLKSLVTTVDTADCPDGYVLTGCGCKPL